MYLIIFEDYSIRKTKVIIDENFSDCNEGYISIIDITDNSSPKEYVMGEWWAIDEEI